MIHEGERNKEAKLKLIEKFEQSKIKFTKEQAERFLILYLCSKCSTQISYEPAKTFKNDRIGFHYDDYKPFFENDSDFTPFINNYKNTEHAYWGGLPLLCLDCASGVDFNEATNNACNKCGTKYIITGTELDGKPCPICSTILNEGIKLQGLETLFIKERELNNIQYDIYREHYHVKATEPKYYTKEEIAERERRKKLKEYYNNDLYVINNLKNVINFELDDSFVIGSFSCILEWKNNEKGKLSLFKMFNDIWVEKEIEYTDIENIISTLNKYNYFNKSFFKQTFGLDGYTFGLEVKLNDKYKELAIWGIKRGILYDIGMMLIQLAGKTFKELYEYAW